MTDLNIVPASYKDPAGFVFKKEGQFYRQVNNAYAIHYKQLMQSGLYQVLTAQQLLLPHTEVPSDNSEVYKTLHPEQLVFISYPYEWSFDMLKDAALLTLEINLQAMQHGMILKDASAFNIQIHKGKPIFIDTISFEKYDVSKPWVAYRQFCSHFLFPLLLAKYGRFDAQRMLSIHTDGLPVDVTANLLPFSTKLKLGTLLHVHLQRSISTKKNTASTVVFNQQKTIRIVQHLQSIIQKIQLPIQKTTWNNYYDHTILSNAYLTEKEKLFRDLIGKVDYTHALDLGANDGYFSKIMAEKATQVIAADYDSHCINRLYELLKKEKRNNIVPLCIDLSNPSPALGFNSEERTSFIQRVKVDLVAALAVIHHIVFTNNVPLPRAASFFSNLTSKYLLIEFVPPNDEKVVQIAGERDTHAYDLQTFEQAFQPYFLTLRKITIAGTERRLYLMQKK